MEITNTLLCCGDGRVKVLDTSVKLTLFEQPVTRASDVAMDTVVNDTFGNVTVNWNMASDRKPLNTSAFLPWLVSRSRIFLYLSNPYEESFEFEHQVADYHTEVTYTLFNNCLAVNAAVMTT